jgi:hypothetical protein
VKRNNHDIPAYGMKSHKVEYGKPYNARRLIEGEAYRSLGVKAYRPCRLGIKKTYPSERGELAYFTEALPFFYMTIQLR